MQQTKKKQGGSVGAYAFEPSTGQLALLNSQSSQGTCPCYVAEDKTEQMGICGKLLFWQSCGIPG